MNLTFARFKKMTEDGENRCLIAEMFLEFIGENEAAGEFLCAVFKVGGKPKAA